MKALSQYAIKDCIDEVIKIILEKYEGEADKEGGEYSPSVGI